MQEGDDDPVTITSGAYEFDEPPQLQTRFAAARPGDPSGRVVARGAEEGMGLLDRDPAKQLERESAKEERRRLAEEDKRQRQAAAEAKRIASSPQGRARAAYEAGAKLFQISLDVALTEKSILGAHVMYGAATTTKTREVGAGTDLESIEAEGWRLEHVGYVFRPTGTESRDKFLASGQIETVLGNVVGIYLFRRAEPPSASVRRED
jgi:hypothetical protein